MMRPTVAALLGGLLAITTAFAQAPQSIAITNVTVIDGAGNDFRRTAVRNLAIVNEVDLREGLGKLAGVAHAPGSPQIKQFAKR